jgi:hypothetical protein
VKSLYLFDDFEEEFTSQRNRTNHYNKHIKDNKEFDMSEDEYEKYSEELMNTPCDYKNIFGYIALDKKTGDLSYIKYDKRKEFMTVYNKNHKTVTSFKRSYREFIGKMYDSNQRYEYIDEIPREE